MGRWMDGWVDGLGWMDGWMDGCSSTVFWVVLEYFMDGC